MPKYQCQACGRGTEHISMRQAARRIQKNRKTIKTWVEKEWVAFMEHPSGRVYVCAECLLKAHRPRDVQGGQSEKS
jgi:DNA-directed RNA polymerase subunit RPC12/RpoP